MGDEKSETMICADIAKLSNLLNEALARAHSAGLKVYLGNNGGLRLDSGPQQISVRVWRETVLVNQIPSCSKDLSFKL